MQKLNNFKEEISERFKILRKSLGKSQKTFALELGIHQSTIANIENSKIFPNMQFLNILYKNYKLNTHWLLTGEGEMFLSSEESIEDISINFTSVPEISPASCGSSGVIPQEEILGYKAFEKKFIKKFKAPVVTTAKGDSMEPLIYDGDLILIDRDPEYRLHPKNDSIYLINNQDTSEELAFTLKRILLEGTTLILIPQNPAYEIQKTNLYKKNILNILLGRVVWYGRELE